MANNQNGFLLDNESPEQNYSAETINFDEQVRLIQSAMRDKVELVAVYEAECSCIGIMPRRVATVLVAHLNSSKHDPLEPLTYIGDVIPQDVLDYRKEHNG